MTDATNKPEAANEPITPAQRLAVLQAQHKALDEKVAELQINPYQNQFLLRRLKKEKLVLKDKIERLKSEMIPDLNA